LERLADSQSSTKTNPDKRATFGKSAFREKPTHCLAVQTTTVEW
jgi:hypothetical protein